MPGSGLTVHDAAKSIDGLTVLDGVSFTAVPGDVTALLGPNGAGKSTLLRAVTGIDRLDAGRVVTDGTVGALLGPDALHPRRTARDHLRVLAAAADLPRTRADDALELVGLRDVGSLPAQTLSLGMRQRLGIATALLADPDLVVLDEPHNGLDAAAIRWLRTALRRLADAGRTVLLSSHLLGEVEAVADRVVVLHDGHVVADGPTPEVVGDAATLEDRYLALVGEP